MTDTDIPALIERLRQAIAWMSDMSKPAAVLPSVAMKEAIEALSRLSVSPLPEEIVGLISALQELGGTPLVMSTMKHAAAAPQQQAREIERLKTELEDSDGVHLRAQVAEARIRDLEATRDTAVEELNHRVTHMKNMELRVNELEAERDSAKKWNKRHREQRDAAIIERDAIRAKTIGECIAVGNEVAKAWSEEAMRRCAENNWSMAGTNNAHAEGAREVVDSIRALNQPPEAGEGE